MKKIKHNLHYLPVSDEKAHIDLCGAKQVPILKTPDEKVIVESLDIVKLLDSDSNYPPNPFLAPHSSDPKFRPLQEFSSDPKLTMWRISTMKLPEFASQADIDYFTKKKELHVGSFKECKQQDEQLKSQLHKQLKDIEHLFPEPNQLNEKNGLNGENWSYDDITLFPKLRTLTCIRGIEFPPKIKSYIDHVHKHSNVKLFYDQAI